MSATQSLPNGTYYLQNESVGGCLTVTDDKSTPQVWSCNLGSAQQQWELLASSNVTYSVKNVAYNTYITPDLSSTTLVQNSTPYSWYMSTVAQNFVAVALNSSASLGWYDHDNTNGSTVMLSTCCGADANYWLYVLSTQTQTNAPGPSMTNPPTKPSDSDQTWIIIAGVFIGLSALFLGTLVGLVCWHKRQPKVLKPVGP